MEEKKKAYAYWLNSIPGIGSRTIQDLLYFIGDYEEIYASSQERLSCFLKKKQLDLFEEYRRNRMPEAEYQEFLKQNILFLTKEEELFPEKLKEIQDPPQALFVKGRVPSSEVLSVAVVGARECSNYGSYIGSELGRNLALAGFQVISGMARGIDGICQQAALSAGGTSFGVLGCGVDICYPAQNRSLYERLLLDGGVLSPYLPGTLPRPELFPPRNRIVSALADVVVVVEARKRSGTFITVDMALEQGKEVYAVPGRITDGLSDGCNYLIKQGAGVILGIDEFIEELKMQFASRCSYLKDRDEETKKSGRTEKEGNAKAQKNVKRLRTEQTAPGKTAENKAATGAELIEKALDMNPKSVEQIRRDIRESLSYQETLTQLVQLVLRGRAVQVSTGYFAALQVYHGKPGKAD